MKTKKRVQLELVEVEFIPSHKEMEQGKIYYSKKYETTNHLCPCGCGWQTPLPIKNGEWNITIDKDKKVSITPSVLHKTGCRSHYIIINGGANII
jgi:hypothetical protein